MRHRRPTHLAPLLGLAALLAALLAPASPASALPAPVTSYPQTFSGANVQVNGTYTPLVGNFGGDNRQDIFWYAPGSGPDTLWISTAARGTFTKVSKPVSGTYLPVVGDFAGDGYDDILWYAPGTAPDTLWVSVPGSGYFEGQPRTINGTFRPLALDNSLAIPMAIAAASASTARGSARGSGRVSAGPKDAIIWYAPGAAPDVTWTFSNDGTSTYTNPIAISGSPILVPFNSTCDPFEDFIAYQPGFGYDTIFVQDTGTYIPTAITVNGTYVPTAVGGGCNDPILWHGPGAAPDAYWANHGDGTLASAPVAAVTTTGPVIPQSYAGNAYLLDAAGADRAFHDGQVLTSADADQSGTVRPVVGDFDGDLGLDVVFYRPGTGTDVVAYGQTYFLA